MLTTVFGASLYAVATVTAVFLGGLALGAFLGGKLPALTNKSRILVYACLEFALALVAAAITGFLGDAFPAFSMPADAGFLSVLVRLAVVAALILPPTILMGATLPILVGAFVNSENREDRVTQTLYAANTTGGAIGAMAAGFWLIPSVGLKMTVILAATLNALAGLVAFVSRELKFRPDPVPEPVAKPRGAPANTPMAKPGTIYAVAFLSGLILIQLEVCWTRWFSLVLGGSLYSVSLVLAIVLVALALGAWAAKQVLQPLGNGLLLMASAYFLSTTYILITLYSANEIPWTFLTLCQSLSAGMGYQFETTLVARAILIAIIVGVPTFLLGTVLPLLFGASVENKSTFVARVYSINVLGCIAGALLTGFLLIPSLSGIAETGIRWTMIISLIAQILISCWLFMQWSRSFVTDPDTRSIVVGIVIFVAAAVIIDVALFRPEWNRAIASAGASFFTPEDMRKMDRETFNAAIGALEGQDTIRFYREGLNSTVTVAQDERRNVTYLKTDGKVEAAVPTDPVQPSRGSDVRTHQLLGQLPSQMVSGTDIKALVIGYGSGTTSSALLADKRISELTIAELESAVYSANKYFAPSTGDPLSQTGRVKPIVNDGRFVLRSSPQAYNIIVCQPSDPWVAGASELFTHNFWSLAKSRLKDNGVFAQWLPLYSLRSPEFVLLLKTFSDVFPNCAIVVPSRAGDCILLGVNSEIPVTSMPGDAKSFTVVYSDGIRKMVQFVRQQPNTDDHNVIEFAAARAAMTPEQNIDENAAIIQHHAAPAEKLLSR
jgi:spermidine synthase